MMWRLFVLPGLFLLIPPLLVVAYHLLNDGQAEEPPGRTPAGRTASSPVPAVAQLQSRIASWMRQAAGRIPLEKKQEHFRKRCAAAAEHLARGLALGLTAGACVLGLVLVGLVRGAAARRRMISNFGFSSPTRFLMARMGLGAVLVSTWFVCFLPLQGGVIAFVWCVLAGMTCLLSYMLAKQFPVVW